MASGPTQNYDDPTLVGWRPHPVLARLLRVALAVVPAAVALGAAAGAVRVLPPERVGLHPWLWLALEVAASALLLVVLGRVARRLLPLTTLLRLTLVLPDRVPSRFAAVRRRTPLENLLARVKDSGDDADPDAAVLLELVAALSRHDRATFRHSERVQAYATLIGRELGLGPADAARLGWAALLHDVGKLTVPPEVLNKPGRPDAQEWAAISGHAAAGAALAAPLARWLGPWAAVIDQHHERWDGAGYPRGLAGEQISPGARIVAVADAFDVITSARAYKAPLSPDAARAELARCTGSQFDPQVVRALLAVSLGELRTVVWPLALLGTLPALPTLHRGASQTLARTASAGSGVTAAIPSVAAAMVVGAGLAVASPVLSGPMTPAADATTVRTEDPADDVAPDGWDGAVEDSGPGEPVHPRDEVPAGGSVRTVDGDPTGATVLAPGPEDPGNGTTDATDATDADATRPDTTDPGAPGTPAPGDTPAPNDGSSSNGGSSSSAGADPAPGSSSGSSSSSSGSSSGLPPSAADPARENADGAVGPGSTPGTPAKPPAPGRPTAE